MDIFKTTFWLNISPLLMTFYFHQFIWRFSFCCLYYRYGEYLGQYIWRLRRLYVSRPCFSDTQPTDRWDIRPRTWSHIHLLPTRHLTVTRFRCLGIPILHGGVYLGRGFCICDGLDRVCCHRGRLPRDLQEEGDIYPGCYVQCALSTWYPACDQRWYTPTRCDGPLHSWLHSYAVFDSGDGSCVLGVWLAQVHRWRWNDDRDKI